MLVEFITSKQLLIQTGAKCLPSQSAVCWLFSTQQPYECEIIYVLVCVCRYTVHLLVYAHINILVVDMYLCFSTVYVWDSDGYVHFYSDKWTITLSAYGKMTVIMTFQRAPVGSIKMSQLLADQRSRSSTWADACDKIMMRLLSSLHINVLTTAYHCHHLACIPCGWWSITDDRTANRSIRDPLWLQANGVLDKQGSEYKMHLLNYSVMLLKLYNSDCDVIRMGCHVNKQPLTNPLNVNDCYNKRELFVHTVLISIHLSFIIPKPIFHINWTLKISGMLHYLPYRFM